MFNILVHLKILHTLKYILLTVQHCFKLTEICHSGIARLDLIRHTQDWRNLLQRRRYNFTVEHRLTKIPRRLCPRDPPLQWRRLVGPHSRRHCVPSNSQTPNLSVPLTKVQRTASVTQQKQGNPNKSSTF